MPKQPADPPPITAEMLAEQLAELARLKDEFERTKRECVGGDDPMSEEEFTSWLESFGHLQLTEDDSDNFPRYQRCMEAFGRFGLLAVVMDLFSRKVVGWSIGDSLATELVSDALRHAIENRRPVGKELLHHSDRGCQYTSDAYPKTWFFRNFSGRFRSLQASAGPLFGLDKGAAPRAIAPHISPQKRGEGLM